MEKYGADLSELPVTNDQIEKIAKLKNETNEKFNMPKNRKDADDLIEKLSNKKG